MTSERRILNDRFRLLVTLGGGGMGSVWLAEDLLLERSVALKELVPHNGGDDLDARRERALQEARALARVRHPAIVPIHDAFFTDGDPWIVMEYIEGRSLQSLIESHPLDDATVARIGLHVLRGLVAAHRAGVVHRDVKPDNILVAGDDSIFLVDFGIAKIASQKSLTRLNNVVGTPEYIAPERLQPGAHVGPPADLWSLGVTFYRAIEGDSPFRRDSEYGPGATAHAILHEAPRPPARESRLTSIILRMLIKDPSQRAEADEVIRVLTSVLRRSVVPPSGQAVLADDAAGAHARGPEQAPVPVAKPAVKGDMPDRMRMRVNDVRGLIRSVGTDPGVAMLLAIPEQDAAAILATYPARESAQLVQGIANARPPAAAAILQMLSSATAARTLGYLRSDSAAALLAAMPTTAAIRILDRASEQSAARAVKDLPVPNSVRLFKAMNSWRAAAVLGHVKPVVAAAVLHADTELAGAVLRLLDESAREQIARHMTNRS